MAVNLSVWVERTYALPLGNLFIFTVYSRHGDIEDMVRACQNVGTIANNTNSLAVALTVHFCVLGTRWGLF